MSRVDIFKREEISITLLYFINDQDRQTQKHIKHPYLYFKVGFREERTWRGAREGGGVKWEDIEGGRDCLMGAEGAGGRVLRERIFSGWLEGKNCTGQLAKTIFMDAAGWDPGI